MLAFFTGLQPCVVAMEACGGAHFWGREIGKLGHDVRLIPPAYVNPFVKRQKNDAADAEAICEAALRPTMRFVPVKSEETQGAAMVFRVRELLIRQRTQAINALRGHLSEFGQVVPQGAANASKLVAIINDPESGLPAEATATLQVLIGTLAQLEAQIAELGARIAGCAKENDYTGYDRLTRPSRTGGAPIKVAHCWAHARCKLKEIFDQDGSQIAAEGLRQIAEFYRIEAEIRGMGPGQRLSARQTRTAPLVAAFGEWLQAQRLRISAKSRLGEKPTYIHRQWDGLQTFLSDGRVEIDSNAVENLIRPIALTRKNALFAGHDEGARAWGHIASLIATAKVNKVEPFAYLKATLEAIAAGHPANHIDELMPWNFKPAS